ncbi:M-phase inducer phosphatase 3 isoform 2-T2 [Anomaloglossus baeobatrachus]|uniref:M-phase inducer phosphatase 3 isoform X2 n=1 Tax=Anomaloglossus baeobatrachus TaxID=238106 RepID=UPI003F507C40
MADNPSKTSDGKKSSSGLAFRTNCRMLLNLRRDKDASVVYSPDQPLTPITDLAVGFSNLSTLCGETPKRCLDLSNLSADEVGLQNFVSPVKMPKDKGESTNSMCIQTEDLKCHKKKVGVLPRLLCSTPSFKKSYGTPSHTRNKENENNSFKNPGKPCPLLLLRGAEADVQLSPTFGVKDDLCTEYDPEMHVLGSPIGTVPTCVVDEDKEHLDGFTECFAMDVEETAENTSTVAANLSSSMATLLNGPFLTQDVDVSNVSMNRSRLYRSPSMPEKLNRPVLKRTIKPLENETPVKMKRRRSTNSPLHPEDDENCQPKRRGYSLKKTLSLCDVEITTALDEDYSHRQLIGDFSKVYALPTVTGRHQDLRYITAETGAMNLHRGEDVLDYFLTCPLVPSVVEKRIILVFHCEFSTERGPKMSRFLREEDRVRNNYPTLCYPEVYLLKGGYREFFPEYKTLCEPQSYCPMHHQDYRQELLKCRTKSKSWAGERKRRDQIARLMKL